MTTCTPRDDAQCAAIDVLDDLHEKLTRSGVGQMVSKDDGGGDCPLSTHSLVRSLDLRGDSLRYARGIRVVSYMVVSYMVVSYMVVSHMVVSYMVVSHMVVSHMVVSYMVLRGLEQTT